MAKNRLTRYLSVLWDREAARRLQDEAEAALERAGKLGADAVEQEMAKGGTRAGRALTSALNREYRIRMGRARQQLAEGAIDEKAFRREGEQAAREFNAGLSSGLKKLQGANAITDLQAAQLQGRFKTVPGAVAAGGLMGRLGGALRYGPLAGIFGGAALLAESNQAIDAADRLDVALRKLGGTAKITGIPLEDLRGFVNGVRDSMRLTEPAAVDLTATMAKLTQRAGEVERTGAAMVAWLNLAAANGIDTAMALDALNTTLAGNDEGLNRLGLANPQQIYEKWGAGADEASRAAAILNEVLEKGATVTGAHAEAMNDSAGRANIARQRVEELRAEIGKSLQPMRDLGNEMRIGFYQAAAGVASLLERWREWRKEAGTSAPVDRFGLPLPPAAGATAGSGAPAAPAGAERPAGYGRASRTATPASVDTTPILRPLAPLPTEAEKRAAEQRVQALWDHLEKWTRSQQAYDAVTGMAGPVAEGPNAPPIAGAVEVGNEAWERYLDVVERAHEVSIEAAYQMSAAFQDAFTLMAEEGATLGNFFEALGRGFAGSMLAGLAQFAQQKVAYNIAQAIEATAEALGFTSTGMFPNAAAAWSSAAQHTAAAAAWGALAGGAGAARGAVAGGAGAIPPSTRDVGLETARDAERDPAQITVYVDPFSEQNPVHVRKVGRAMELDVRLGGRPEWAR